ncbi:MAG: S8/S53 family peptidase [Bdellovibrio sp.]|nr:S8/S53 family peptidase [Bdellovibrio sp.]
MRSIFLITALFELGSSVALAAPDQVNCPDPEAGVELPAEFTRLVEGRIYATDCPLIETCPGNGKNKLWAQEKVDADLMQEEMARIGVGHGHSKVAVIDSGFDLTTNARYMASPNLSVKPGIDDALSDPENDTDGHGTAVASLIGGGNGIGIAPDANLTVYGISASDANRARTTTGNVFKKRIDPIKQGIEKACAEGNEVINVSWGGLYDETGAMQDEQADPDFLTRLAARGCLVVRSAGNMGVRVDRPNDPDDAYLRVEATSPIGGAANFSANGEIAAPGTGVFTLESSVANSERKSTARERCEGDGLNNPGQFVNGTSFSSPIVAGIAAQVIGVLKKSSRYVGLSGPDRIKLVNRILRASTLTDSANGLRALMIAERWNASTESSIPSIEELKASLSNPEDAVCSQRATICSASIDCNSLKTCISRARKIAALCGFSGVAPDIPTTLDLIKLAQASNNLELAATLLNKLRSVPASKLKDLAKASKKFWQSFFDEGPASLDFDLVRKQEYYALFRDIVGVTMPFIEEKIRSKAREQILSTDVAAHRPQIENYRIELMQSLFKHKLANGLFYREIASSPVADSQTLQQVIFAVRDAQPRLSGSVGILKKVIASPSADKEVIDNILYAVESGKLPQGEGTQVVRALIRSGKGSPEQIARAKKLASVN